MCFFRPEKNSCHKVYCVQVEHKCKYNNKSHQIMISQIAYGSQSQRRSEQSEEMESAEDILRVVITFLLFTVAQCQRPAMEWKYTNKTL